jgi:hypothetical protein
MRLRPVASLFVPLALVAFAAGCEQIAGIGGSFELQAAGVSGSSSGVGGTAGVSNEGDDDSGQGGLGTGGAGGQAGVGGGQAGVGGGQAGVGGGQAGVGGGGSAGAPVGGSGGGDPPAAFVTALATGQENVRQLVSDGKVLFWLSAGTKAANFADGKVLACALSGCNDHPIFLAENQAKPEHLHLADENVAGLPDAATWGTQLYWTNTLDGTVRRVRKEGGEAPVIIVQGQNQPAGVSVSSSASALSDNGVVAAGEPFLYWASSGEGVTKRCKLDVAGEACQTPEIMHGGMNAPGYLVTGRTYVYWLTPGTEAGNFQDGELFRYRKNVEPFPSRPDEQRVFKMSDDLHRPGSLYLDGGRLFIAAFGDQADGAATGTIWMGNPLANDYELGHMTQYLDGVSLNDVVATTEFVYWNSGGQLYACKRNGCEGGPVAVRGAENIGTGPMTVENVTGQNEDVIYTVNARTVIRIRITTLLLP